MSEIVVFKNPNICWHGKDEINAETFKPDEWDIEVRATRKVKPYPDGTIILALVKRDGLYHKLEDVWYYTKLDRPDQQWRLSNLYDSFFRANIDKNYKVIYEPES